MDHFQVSDIVSDTAYTEFLREPAMSAGIYRLPAGSHDPQQPHTEDELYCVISGRGQIMVGGEHRAVGPGSMVYVPRLVEHRFHSITEALTILVVFSPAEYALRGETGKQP
jgi:mannose-6-phosphate isomerase-like protein (cupin superfamily)